MRKVSFRRPVAHVRRRRRILLVRSKCRCRPASSLRSSQPVVASRVLQHRSRRLSLPSRTEGAAVRGRVGQWRGGRMASADFRAGAVLRPFRACGPNEHANSLLRDRFPKPGDFRRTNPEGLRRAPDPTRGVSGIGTPARPRAGGACVQHASIRTLEAFPDHSTADVPCGYADRIGPSGSAPVVGRGRP